MLPNEDQCAIAEMARQFARERLKPFAEQWSREHRYPAEAIGDMAALGFFGMLVPEQWGGSDTGYLAYAMALEEIAAGDGTCSTIMSVHNSVGCVPILRFGNDQQKRDFLGPLARGEQIGAFALTEPQAGSDASSLRTRARRDGDRYVLNGAKQFITSGKHAGTVIVFAVTDPDAGKRGISAFIVPTDSPGYQVVRVEDKLGQHASDTCQIAFEDLRVPVANRLGEEGEPPSKRRATTPESAKPLASRSSSIRLWPSAWPTWPRRSPWHGRWSITLRRCARPDARHWWRPRWPSCSPRRWRKGSARQRSRPWVATATCPTSRWSASTATYGFARSTKAPATSSAWSSPATSEDLTEHRCAARVPEAAKRRTMPVERRFLDRHVDNKNKIEVGNMQPGLMQNAPLLISGILTHAARAHGDREIVSRLVDEPLWRYDYAGLANRAAQAASMLRALGIGPGDCVSSLAWNTHRHYELFFAVPGIGAVLHTANPRLSDEQIVYTINHAGSQVLLFDSSFAACVARLRPRLSNIRHFIELAAQPSSGLEGVMGYEQLIAVEQPLAWPQFDENAGAVLCYTSGTTGDPKGVLYSHRSVVLHAMAAGLSGAFGLSAFDCIMPCSSLYHGTAWGLPFAAAINGCKFVLPCDKMDGASLQELIKSEGVTLSGGVPTIWTMYLAHLERSGEDSGSLARLVIGGSAVPRAMAETFQTKYGVAVCQLWGMTETSPLGVVATPTPKLAERGQQATNDTIWSRQGRLQFGIELKVVDEQGNELPCDGVSSGSLKVRGPWTVERYYRSEKSALDAEGWFDTGDIATLDADGFMRITDRSKDVIKSGGEWVSSIDIENVAAACPGVKVAAVVGVFHPKWEERPLLVVEPHSDAEITVEQILAHLEPNIVKWWMPDAVIFDAVPLTATGKIDKKVLRERYRNHLVENQPSVVNQ